MVGAALRVLHHTAPELGEDKDENLPVGAMKFQVRLQRAKAL
jgi:hypothetical protein